MATNPGRNDPCPCGSGKKYKHCCLADELKAAESPAELTWRRIRRVLDEFGMPTKLSRFIDETYGPGALEEAWAEFTVWDDEDTGFDAESPHLPLFMSWFFHAWSPDPQDTSVREAALHDRPPTAVFLEHRGERLDPLLYRYLKACVEAPFSFYEIVRCNPGHDFHARDVLTGEEFEVREQSASKTLSTHDVIFAQVVTVDGVVMLECCSPFGLDPTSKIAILDMRDRIAAAEGQIRAAALRDYDIELRELYLSMTNRFLEPHLPELQNTDGDPLVLQKVVFEIDSPQRAFDALKHLAREESEQDLLRTAKRGGKGELREVSVPWTKAGNARHGGMKNTLLGEIRITPRRLTCQVNSVKRAEMIKAIIEEALGAHARFRATEVQSVERMMADGMSGQPPRDSQAEKEQAELMARPEVQAKLNEILAAHYDQWVTEKIPALGDQTPLDAVRTPGGRERVEALLIDMERRSTGMPHAPDPEVFRRLRDRLGLERREE